MRLIDSAIPLDLLAEVMLDFSMIKLSASPLLSVSLSPSYSVTGKTLPTQEAH